MSVDILAEWHYTLSRVSVKCLPTDQPTAGHNSISRVSVNVSVVYWPTIGIPCTRLISYQIVGYFHVSVACENICFSSLFAAGDISRGGTSATQQQKFHTDDAHQCLHNKSGSHGVPNIDLSNFVSLLVNFGKVLC